MLRRALFSATAISRISALGAQQEMSTPLVHNDGIVQSPLDEFARPPKNRELAEKYGPYAKYANTEFTKVDTSAEVVLNNYPEGAVDGRLEQTGHDTSKFSASWIDETFFRDKILKPKAAQKHEDTSRVLDYALNGSMVGLGALIIRYSLAPVWWVGQPRMTLVNESNVEVDIGVMEAKECKTIVWRGKPVYVYRRSPAQMKAMEETPMSALKHPETDEQRFPINREYAVVIAICTHLGCIPAANEGAFAGFFCPCHGSHYDASARIRTGPAPLNLEVPPYKWLSDSMIYLGS